MNTLYRRGDGFSRLSILAVLVSLTCAKGLDASPGVDAGFACATCPVLSADELEAMRGGFRFAGLNFEFGANIRSFIDNQLVLESIVTITSDGAIQHQITTLPDTMPGLAIPPQTTNSGAQGTGAVLPVSGQPSAASSVAAPSTVDLTGLGNALGVSVNDHKGFTAALHEATRQRITSTLVNTANDRKLRQEMEIRINVENFRQFQDTARQNLLNARIGASRLR
jgi:hypothetical protein